MAPAELLGGGPVLGWRAVDALALDGLDDERGDIAGAQLLLQGVEISEGNGDSLRQQRPEAAPEFSPPFSARAPVVSPWKACSA